MFCWSLFFFFFFQAEDGIRDLYVTGVQTCALPISWRAGRCAQGPALSPLLGGVVRGGVAADRPGHRGARSNQGRSEEHTSELQSRRDLVCRLLLEKKKQN